MVKVDGGCKFCTISKPLLSEELLKVPFAGCEMLFVT
jgi:hypothetical protein